MGQSDPASHAENPAKVESQDLQQRQSSQEEDGFIDVQHADVDMQDTTSDEVSKSPPSAPLALHRYGSNLEDVDDVVDEEDDSEDERDPMANHPLLNMLTGRLGARRRGSAHKWDRLHPENQILSVSNADECSLLEGAAFPPEERASREKVRTIPSCQPSDMECCEDRDLSNVAF
jgi:hypothetical protein